MTFIKSIRSKRGRVNTDRMLQFYGDTTIDKYISFTSDSRYNFGASDFWISFFSLDYSGSNSGFLFQFYKAPQNLVLKRNINQHFEFIASSAQTSGTQQWFQTGLSAIRHFVVRRSGEKMQLFVNGKRELEQLIDATDTFDFSGVALAIGNRINFTEAFNGSINNFIVANGTITDDQIRLIYSTGVAPPALHSGILNHWPLTQWQYKTHLFADKTTGHIRYGNTYSGSGDYTGDIGTLGSIYFPISGTTQGDTVSRSISSSVGIQGIKFLWNRLSFVKLKYTVTDNNSSQIILEKTIDYPSENIEYEQILNFGGVYYDVTISLTYVQYLQPGAQMFLQEDFLFEKQLVAWDVVEQYNYANARMIDDFSVWTLGDSSFSQTINSLSYDGTAGGLRNAYDDVVGGSIGDLIRVRFNVSALSTGGKLWIFYGSNTALVERHAVNSTGIKELWLRYTAGGSARIYIGNGDGFGATDITATWTIEGFEILPFDPIHGTLVNFANAEIGADEPDSQTAVIDMYSKQRASDWGLKFDALLDQYAQQSPLTNNITTTSRDNLTLYARFSKINDTGDADIPVLFRSGSSVAFAINVARASNVITLQARIDGSQGVATFQNNTWDRELIMVFEKLTENPSTWILYLNGIMITPTSVVGAHGTTSPQFDFTEITLGGAFSGSASFDFDGVVKDVALWDRLLTAQEKIDLYRDEVLPPVDLLERIIIGKRSDTVVNTYAGNQLVLNNFTLANHDSYYVTKRNLPELKETYKFIRSNNHYITVPNFNPTKEKGYTYIVGYTKDSDVNFLSGTEGFFMKAGTSNKVLFGAEGTKRAHYNTIGQAGVFADFKKSDSINWFIAQESATQAIAYANGIQTQTSGISIIGFDEIGNNDLRIGQRSSSANGLDANMFFLGVWKGLLSKKQMLKIVNNTLGDLDLYDDCQLFLVFNSDQMYEDGTNVYIKDHSPQNRTCIWNGLTGATTSDQLASLLINVVDINDLR